MKFIPQPEPLLRLFVVCSLLTLASCNDDSETTSLQPIAQFKEPTLSFVENEGEQTITIQLDRPTSTSGFVVLSIQTSAPNAFVTSPAADNGQLIVPVEKQQSVVTFRLIPSDNLNMDGCKVIKFTILQASEGVVAGDVRDLVVSLNDDEAPAEGYFTEPSLRLRESEPAGASITLQLNGPAPAEGVLVVKLQSSVAYGTSYTTDPAPVGSKLLVHFAEGSQSAVIKVFPVNDSQRKADRELSFSIVDASGGVSIGRDITFECTITDDDGQQLTNIKSVKSLYDKVPMILHGDYYIEATVTTIDNTVSGRVVVEDYSGALPLQLLTNQKFTRGDLVLVNLNLGTLQELNGVLEVGQVSQAEVIGRGEMNIRRMSIDQLFSGGAQYQSQTVQLVALSFNQADGTTTMLGDRVATDGVRIVTVRTNPQASFRDELVPQGIVNVTGVVVTVDGNYYLYPQEYTDIRKQQFLIRR